MASVVEAPRNAPASHLHPTGIAGDGRPSARSIPGIARFQDWHPDGTSVLTLVLALTFFIPNQLTIPALGGLGRPELLLSIALFGWWGITKLVPSMTVRGNQPIRWLLALYFCSFAVSYVAGHARGLTPAEASSADRFLIFLLGATAIALVVADGVPTRARLDTLLSRITYFGAYLGITGSLQFLFNFDITDKLNIPFLALNNELFGIQSRSTLNRVSGTSTHPIEYGAVLAMCLMIAIHFIVTSTDRKDLQRRVMVAGLIALPGAFSVSRTNAASVVIGLLVLAVVWNARHRFYAFLAGCAGVAALQVVAPGLLATIRALFLYAGEDPSISGRRRDYDQAFVFIGERPILGRGSGTFIPDEYFILDNQWLGELITKGYVGLFVLGLMFVVPIMMTRIMRKSVRAYTTLHLTQTVFAVMAIAAFASVTFDSFFYVQFRMLWFVMMGVAGTLWRLHKTDQLEDLTDVSPEELAFVDQKLHRKPAGSAA